MEAHLFAPLLKEKQAETFENFAIVDPRYFYEVNTVPIKLIDSSFSRK